MAIYNKFTMRNQYKHNININDIALHGILVNFHNSTDTEDNKINVTTNITDLGNGTTTVSNYNTQKK